MKRNILSHHMMEGKYVILQFVYPVF